MAKWLLKTEPASYGWADLVRDGGTEWDGVRNAAAAINLRAMRQGDLALLYHSVTEKAVVGTVRITREARKDGAEGNWVSVAIEPVDPLTHPVTLAAMKADPRLAGLAMLRQSRLSVSPVGEEEWAVLMELAG
ncbi:EVE domain-containing protein [uncultured Sphingomonas sp.]|uniref:EVE domain-containing protein n=1 Tax=uncultured Sphingomonas sp. TaxID=158754 RepID=UPI0035CA7AF8